MVLEEVAPQLGALTTNVYGNYVIQLLVKYGGPEAQELVFEEIKQKTDHYSKHMFACRVVQSLVTCLPLEKVLEMVEVIQPSAVELIYDVSGNHVIQKMVKRLDEGHLYFLKAAISQPIDATIAPPFIPKSDDNIEPDAEQLKLMAKDKQAC